MTQDEAVALICGRRGTMYDPHIVDVFIGLLPTLGAETLPPPRLQRAVTRIRTAALQEASMQPALAVPEPEAAGSTVGRLSRLASGAPSIADLAHLMAPELQMVAPGSQFVFYAPSADGRLAGHAVPGPGGADVDGHTMLIGERVSGWAGATRQQVVNADAQLDLDTPLAPGTPCFCLATPLVHQDHLVGVLTAYASAAFTDDVTRAMTELAQGLTPVVALASPTVSGATAHVRSRSHLRVAASR